MFDLKKKKWLGFQQRIGDDSIGKTGKESGEEKTGINEYTT